MSEPAGDGVVGSGDGRAVRPVYVVLDTSGSTVRGGFAAGCEQVMPLLIDAAARRSGLLMSVLAYGTRADTLVWLTEPADIELIPAVTPAGLSSLAAGLRLLADSIRLDASRLAADGIPCLDPVVVVLTDGLPTDPAASLLDARDALDAALAGIGGVPTLVYAAPPGDCDLLAIAGLRMAFQPLAAGAPAELAASVLAVFEDAIRGPG